VGQFVRRDYRSGVLFLRKIVSRCKAWLECDCWIYVFKLGQFVRRDYPYYYDEFNDRILRIFGAEFCHSVAHVYVQTSHLASFKVEIATKFLSLVSKMIEMKSHVVIYKGVQRSALSTRLLYIRCKSQRRNSNSDIKVLTIVLRYTAAFFFWTGDSLTTFRNSIIAF